MAHVQTTVIKKDQAHTAYCCYLLLRFPAGLTAWRICSPMQANTAR